MRKSEEHCEEYDRDPDSYRQGSKMFDFSKSVYGHVCVRRTLSGAQHDKCCYCESRLDLTSRKEVEHFRPKGAVQQESGQNKVYPGYYWLAYSWTNLLMSCNVCNSTHKRTLFPLESQTERARSHHDNLEGERPLFIDPASEDPRRHIRFRGPAVVAATEKGRTTIQGLGLRRSPLEEARMERLARLKDLRWIVGLEGKEGIENSVGAERIQNARRALEDAVLPSATYSAMAMDFLENGPD